MTTPVKIELDIMGNPVVRPAARTLAGRLKARARAWFERHDAVIVRAMDRIDAWVSLDFGKHADCEREIARLKGSIKQLQTDRERTWQSYRAALRLEPHADAR